MTHRKLNFESLSARLLLSVNPAVGLESFSVQPDAILLYSGDHGSVTQQGNSVLVSDGGNDDVISIVLGEETRVVLSGHTVVIPDAVDQIFVDDGIGNDEVLVTGTNMFVDIDGQNVAVQNGDVRVNLTDNELVQLIGGEGYDFVRFHDTPGRDSVYLHPGLAAFESSFGQTFVARGFEYVVAIADNGGWDRANFYDSPGDDRFVGRESYSYMEGDRHTTIARGFERVDAFARQGGDDEARLHGSDGDDHLSARPEQVIMSVGGTVLVSHNYSVTRGYAHGGNDVAEMFGSQQNDSKNTLVWEPHSAFMRTVQPDSPVDADSQSFHTNFAIGFDAIVANNTAGEGRAEIRGSEHADEFVAFPRHARMRTPDSAVAAKGFELVRAFGRGGNDSAYLYGADGDDRYVSNNDFAFLHSRQAVGASVNYVSGFEIDARTGLGGNDQVWLNDLNGQPVNWEQNQPLLVTVDEPAPIGEVAVIWSFIPNFIAEGNAKADPSELSFSNVAAVYGEERRERVYGFSTKDFRARAQADLNWFQATIDCTPGCTTERANFNINRFGNSSSWTEEMQAWQFGSWTIHKIKDGAITDLQDDLNAARERWEAFQIASYVMSYEITCGGCSTPPATITVDNNEVTSAAYLGRTINLEITVDWMFDQIQSAIDNNYNIVRATFDPVSGRPTSFYTDRDPDWIDDDFGVNATSFSVPLQQTVA